MELLPFPQPNERRRKTAKHYFKPAECFWELVDRPQSQWLEERLVLEQAGVYTGTAIRNPPPQSRASQLLDERYVDYHRLAEQACDEARDSQHVYPHHKENDRAYYLGQGGLIAIVSTDARRALVTAFRAGLIRNERCFEESSERYLLSKNVRLRAAVRRRDQRASYS